MRNWVQVLAGAAAVLCTSSAARADKVLYLPGSADIVLAQPDGSGARYVVRNRHQIFDASLSHDEKSVFFAMHDFQSNRDIVYRVNSDGSGVRELATPGVRSIYRISCSPIDGRLALIGTGADGQRGAFTANADGSGVRLLRSMNAPQALQWRSDGGALVAVDKVSEPDGICLLLTTEGELMRSLPIVAFRRDIEWSAGSGLLVFASFASRRVVDGPGGKILQGDIYTIRADGTGLRRLTTQGDNFSATFSPDGRRILYSLFRNEAGSYGGLRLMNADGSQKQPITLTLPDGSMESGGVRLDWGPLRTGPSSAPSVRIATPAHVSVANGFSQIRGLLADGDGLSDVASFRVALRGRYQGYWNGRAFQAQRFYLATAFSSPSASQSSTAWYVISPLPAPSQLREDFYLVDATVTDKSGLSRRTEAQVFIDLTPPQLALAGVTFNDSRSSLSGTWRDASGVASIFVQLRRGDGTFWNGRAWQNAPFLLRSTLSNANATNTGGTFSLSAGLPLARDLTPGSLLSVLAIDRAGNRGGLQQKIGPPPSVPQT